jgi:hypothetical protein
VYADQHLRRVALVGAALDELTDRAYRVCDRRTCRVDALFPAEFARGADFKADFFANRRWFFGIQVVVVLMDIPETCRRLSCTCGWSVRTRR